MKLTIDNLQGLGSFDYTACLDTTIAVLVERGLNRPSELRMSLVGDPDFIVPVVGARITLGRNDGSFFFTGYLTQAPSAEYLGWGERGPVYRYELVSSSDEVLLDSKAVPNRAPYVARSAGSAMRQLVEDLLPGGFDTTGVEELDSLASYVVSPGKKFSELAAEIAMCARGSYRALNGALVLAPVGRVTHAIEESDSNFSPAGLKLVEASSVTNDITVVGEIEPQAYVRDYFVGDGLSMRYYLSQSPFQQGRRALIDERYAGAGLDPATWAVSDPNHAVAVSGQSLQISGGSEVDGATNVRFVEQIELGGALELQHGDVSFSGPSQGVIGGLYAGEISAGKCLAGFQVTPYGTGSKIQALVNGVPAGSVIATTAGHRYLLTTYFYSMEVYRAGEMYHSSAHPAGSGIGGVAMPADVRVVMEVLDVDPGNPASMLAPATVLYDDVIGNAVGFCTYAPVNAVNMHCSIAYTYVTHLSLAEVRTALPDSSYVTQPVESLSDGGKCFIASSTTLDFYPQYVPTLNTLIVASYRGAGRAVAEVADAASIASEARGADDGVRGMVRGLKCPGARTQVDCENAALAMLDDRVGAARSGSYRTWSDFLNSGDIFPGDALSIDVPSQAAAFDAIVRKVTIQFEDPANDRGIYTIEFANDAAAPLGYESVASTAFVPLQSQATRLITSQVGSFYLPSLTKAQIVQVSSTTVQVDAGIAPGSEWGIEVRAHDFGFGASNDRNLLGRFSSQSFTLPRLGRTQNYFLRLYDSSSPPRYSRYSAALHVDYPL